MADKAATTKKLGMIDPTYNKKSDWSIEMYTNLYFQSS